MTETTNNQTIFDSSDDYDPTDNAIKSYSLWIRYSRLEGIRDGLFPPNLTDPEEIEAARQGQQDRRKGLHRFDVFCRGEGAAHAICPPAIEFGAGKGIV